jgi:ABC-type antimicrobial peptide transport system permease subunit
MPPGGQEADIYPAPLPHQAEEIKTIVEQWRKRRPGYSFSALLLRAFLRRWLAGFASSCLFVTAFLLQPFWVGALLQYIADNAAGRYNDESRYLFGVHSGYGLASGLVVTSFVAIGSINHSFYHQTRFGCYIRSAVMIYVHEKSMVLAPAARRGYTTGSIVTM